MEEIMISVVLLVYQHAKYICKALDSVLMQKTDYNYEILIVDDASTDGTQSILSEYKEKNSSRIRLDLHSKNLGGTRSGWTMLKNARGKYIALLDGDDYWTDEYKLDKQISFLERNHQYMGVFHKCKIIDENENSLYMEYSRMFGSKKIYTMHDFERGKLPGHTATFVFRNVFRGSNGKYNFFYKIHNMVGDQTIYCILLSMGNLSYLDDEMSIYRLVQKRDGTNAASLSASHNYCFVMWKYYSQLEVCMRERVKKKVNLSVQRKREVQYAHDKLKQYFSIENVWIYFKISLMEAIWSRIGKS